MKPPIPTALCALLARIGTVHLMAPLPNGTLQKPLCWPTVSDVTPRTTAFQHQHRIVRSRALPTGCGKEDDLTATLGLHEAASRCGVSENTIRRRHRSGRLPNTVVTETGWAIPITDLIDDGLNPRSPAAVVEAKRRAHPELTDLGPTEPYTLPERLLREQVAVLNRLIAVQTEHIKDLRSQINQLQEKST